MQERKQHVKLGKERNEKQSLLACFSSERTDLSAFCVKVGRDGARMGTGRPARCASFPRRESRRAGHGAPSPGGMNGPDLAGRLKGTGKQLPPALAPISCRGANHLLGIWPTFECP